MYLTEIIRESGQKVEEWGEGKNMILLEAPTGSGKTYFAQRILPELCRQNDSQMAIIVNRRILREQMERYDKEYMLENNLTVSPVKIMTYQQIESDQDKKILDYLENCEFVVLDEAHYLVSDIRFNPAAQKSFLKLMGLMDKTCLLLMTATPGNLRLLLDEYLDWWNQKREDEYSQKSAEYKEREAQHISDLSDGSLSGDVEALESYHESELYEDGWFDPDPPPEPYHYKVIGQPIQDYSYVTLNCYSSQEDLINEIINSPQRQKWLIFVALKKEEKELKKEIEKAFKNNGPDKRKVAFLSSDFRKDAEMQKIIEEIVKKGSFKESVLICTSVLDNGITISDSRVKNIVINESDECEFKQMLGRRRVKAGETINLFICEGKLSYFKRCRKREYNDFIKAVLILGKTPSEICTAILQKEVTWKAVEEFTYIERSDRHFSKLAYWAHSKHYVRLNDMVQAMENDERAYVKIVCGWLLKDPNSDVIYLHGIEISDEIYKDIVEVIAGLSDVMSKIQYNEFVTELNKITQKPLSTRVDRINYYLSQHESTKIYQFQSIKVAKATFYYIKKEGMFPFVLNESITEIEKLRKLLEENKESEVGDIFRKMFDLEMPECFNDKEQVRFMTLCVQENAGWFKKWCFRRYEYGVELMPCGENRRED